MKRTFPFTVPLVAALAASPVGAQSDPAAAEALFQTAVKLMKDGKAQDACPKLEESQRLDPRAGTLFYLGTCYEAVGKTASAWTKYHDALAALHGSSEREPMIRARIAEVEPKLARLTITVPAETANAPGVVIKRDGIVIGNASWGLALPVDPGKHAIEASASGKRLWTTTVDASPAATTQVVVGPLQDEPKAPATPSAATPDAPGARAQPPAATSPPTAPPSSREEPSTEKPASGAPLRTIGFVVGGVGVVGLLAGGYFGLKHGSSNDDAQSLCPAGTQCSPEDRVAAQTKQDEAKNAGTMSVVSFVAGGALLVGGIVLVVTAPSSNPATAIRIAPLVSPNVAAVSLGGAF